MNYFKESFWGNNGFEELRRFVKSGSDFCKDVAAVMQERSDLESNYAKGLNKLAHKIARASRDSVGTLAQAWQVVATEMEAEGDIHKTLAFSLVEELVKPLRVLIETQHKTRKAIEAVVDKNAKALQDFRNSELKAKKTCYVNAKESERMQDLLADTRLGKGRILSEKDISKMEAKQRKAEDAMKKADHEYYALCLQGERSRLEWESSVYRGSAHFQTLEEERIGAMQEALHKYTNQLALVGPRMVEGSGHLVDAANYINVAADIQTIIQQKGVGPNIAEQYLPDFYAEDMGLRMNKDRRRESVEKFLLLLKHDIERERKGKQGVENLARVFQETPKFGDEDAQQDVHEKIQHMKAMLTYLEATRYKLQCSLANIENRGKPVHPLSSHIEQHKDKQGMLQTILKVPSWVLTDRRNSDQGSQRSDSPEMTDRGAADGTSMLPDCYDEFSEYSQSSGSPIYGNLSTIYQEMTVNGSAISKCRALYEYDANLHDELSIRPGDVISVYSKTDNDWWHGELNGAVGIFPATYVEEIK